MPTLAIKTIKNRRNTSGNINIYISLTFKRKIRYIATGFEIYDEAEFEDGKVCYRRDAAIMNKRLAFILDEYKSKLKRIDTKKFRTCSQLKEALTKTNDPESLSINDLFERRILRLEKEGQKLYVSMNRYTLNVVTSIHGNPPFIFLLGKTSRSFQRCRDASILDKFLKGSENRILLPP